MKINKRFLYENFRIIPKTPIFLNVGVTLEKHQASSIKYQASSIKHQVSSIKNAVSSIQYQVSSIQHQVSSIKYPVPSIEYPVSNCSNNPKVRLSDHSGIELKPQTIHP